MSKTCTFVVLHYVVIGGVFMLPEERERIIVQFSVCLTTCITDNIYAVENSVCFSWRSILVWHVYLRLLLMVT